MPCSRDRNFYALTYLGMSDSKKTVIFSFVSADRTKEIMDAFEEKFRITVQPDKEIIMIIVPENIKDDVMTAIYNEAGLGTAGQGIAFSMSVDRAVGLSE